MKEKISKFADVFTMEEFAQACLDGAFVDSDGSGYYADGEYEYESVRPSQIRSGKFKGYSHVAWYNK